MSIDVLVHGINEAYIKISCEDGIAQEITDHFTFDVPNAKYDERFKKKIWDGKIRLANRRTGLLYRGLLPHLVEFCQSHSYSIHVDDQCTIQEELSLHEGKQFIDSLGLPDGIEQRDYQLDAFVHCIRNKRQVFLSPTGSGKSLTLYFIIRYLEHIKYQKGLLIVPTTSLVEQMYSDFESYGWKGLPKAAHRVYAGKLKQVPHFLTITTWQSMFKQDPSFFKQFDFVIGDEGHLFKANSLKGIMENLTNARTRIACTGTLDGSKTHKLVLEGLFGTVRRIVTTRELMDRGILAQLKIKALILKYPSEVCRGLKEDKADYQEELDYIVGCEARNKFIRNLALSLKGNTLILYQFVQKHGVLLYTLLKEANPYRTIYLIYSGTPAEEREAIRKHIETIDDAIIVASYGTFSTGVNLKNLHNLIMASPSKGPIRNLQSIGRSLRKTAGKDSATLFDIVDDMRLRKHQNFCLRHFLERVDTYNSQRFKYKLYQIDLKGATYDRKDS